MIPALTKAMSLLPEKTRKSVNTKQVGGTLYIENAQNSSTDNIQVYIGIYICPHLNDDNVDNLFVKELQRTSEHPNGPRLLISGTVGKEVTLLES